MKHNTEVAINGGGSIVLMAYWFLREEEQTRKGLCLLGIGWEKVYPSSMKTLVFYKNFHKTHTHTHKRKAIHHPYF